MSLADDLDPGKSYIGLESIYKFWKFSPDHPFNGAARYHDQRSDEQAEGIHYAPTSLESDRRFRDDCLRIVNDPEKWVPILNGNWNLEIENPDAEHRRIEGIIATVKSWRGFYRMTALYWYRIVRLRRWPKGDPSAPPFQPYPWEENETLR